MGTFGGHVLPGSFFILFGLWWTIRILQRYYKAKYQGGPEFISSCTFTAPSLCGRLAGWQLEGAIKIFFTTAGFIGEMVTGFHAGRVPAVGNGQHATMFVFFGLAGVVDIIMHHTDIFPKGVDYVIIILGLLVEALLFKLHVHLSGEIEILLHTLLIYAIMAGVLAVAAEMCFRGDVLITLSRCYTMLLQGTWFWQIAFILYSPVPGYVQWEENHNNMLIASMMFTWHLAAIFVFMLLTGAVIGSYYKRHSHVNGSDDDEGRMELMKYSNNNIHRSSGVNNNDDDIECRSLMLPEGEQLDSK